MMAPFAADDRVDRWLAAGRPPLDDFLSTNPDLPPAAVAQACGADLRRAVAAGRPADADWYLRRHHLEADPEAVLELAYAEFVAREAAGEVVDPDSFAARFGPHADRVRGQLEIDALIAGGPSVEAPTADHAPAAPAVELPRAGRYVLLDRLGAGGQADVYRAVHPLLQTEVAVKLGRAGGVAADALRAEGRELAALDHPHLARVFDLDVTPDGRPFLVMAFVRGRNLRQAAEAAPFAPAAAAKLVAAVARAADHAHRRGVVHRDIKPANVLLTPDGAPVLTDFGLARVAAGLADDPLPDGRVSGTAAYMAPEQARGEPTSSAADGFALGGLLYFLLTGSAPYPGPTVAASLAAARAGDWDRGKLTAAPPRLAAVCARAMSTEPADRYPSAEALADALDAFVAPRRWGRRIATGVAVVAAGLAVALWPGRTPSPASVGTSRETGTLLVAGWAGERYAPLPDAAPLKTRQRVRLEATVPAGHRAALFLLDSSGAFAALEEYAAGEAVQFPRDPNTGVPLSGSAGTEVVVLVAKPGDWPATDVAAAWGAAGKWPTLPAFSVVRLAGRTLTVERGAGREFGPAEPQADPEGEVRAKLAAAGERLRAKFPVVEAVAFRHAD